MVGLHGELRPAGIGLIRLGYRQGWARWWGCCSRAGLAAYLVWFWPRYFGRRHYRAGAVPVLLVSSSCCWNAGAGRHHVLGYEQQPQEVRDELEKMMPKGSDADAALNEELRMRNEELANVNPSFFKEGTLVRSTSWGGERRQRRQNKSAGHPAAII